MSDGERDERPIVVLELEEAISGFGFDQISRYGRGYFWYLGNGFLLIAKIWV